MIHVARSGSSYTRLQASFHSLKISYDASQGLLSEMRHARGWAADGLQSTMILLYFRVTNANMPAVELEPLLDADGNYVHSGEVKALIGQLQDELAGCTHVLACSICIFHTHISSPK
jgi:hypothetical protein